VDLDAPRDYASVDPANALGDVEATAEQWQQAAALGPGRLDLDAIDVVVISGMGGSGIAGDVLWALSLHGYPRPIVVHKGYGVPGFTGPRTLVVSFSHSGSTEETLSGFEEAGQRGAARLVVSSGGPLAERAAAAGVDVALMPRGTRPPRHSLGVLLVPALIALGLDEGLDEAIEVIAEVTSQFGRDVEVQDNRAKQIGQRLAAGVVPLTWGGHGIGSVAAYRLKCQLNENAKLPAVHAELPEAGHNDVVGWEQPSALTGASALLSLRDPAGEHPRVSRRFEITQRFLGDCLAWIDRIDARGTSPLARAASLLVQADLVSVYAALAADRDPTPIRSIDRLKSELGTPTSVG
jgi:glucose/mannose-6-phosphate isomerase